MVDNFSEAKEFTGFKIPDPKIVIAFSYLHIEHDDLVSAMSENDLIKAREKVGQLKEIVEYIANYYKVDLVEIKQDPTEGFLKIPLFYKKFVSSILEGSDIENLEDDLKSIYSSTIRLERDLNNIG